MKHICDILAPTGFFGDAAGALLECSNRFRRWASANQIPHSQPHFTMGMISHDPYPSLNLKAFNGRVFLIFLELCLTTALSDHPNNEELQLAARCATCLAVWFDRTERCGRYLTEEEASLICSAGLRFVGCYEAAARFAIRAQVARFKVVPKLHASEIEV